MRPERPRYILDIWHRCVKRSRFVFFFSSSSFPFCTVGSSRWGSRERKEPSINHISLLYAHGHACDCQRLTISAWPLNGYLLEMKVTRFECQESRRLDQPSPPPPPFFPLSFPEHDPSLNVVVARYLRFVLKPRLSVNVERPGSSLND